MKKPTLRIACGIAVVVAGMIAFLFNQSYMEELDAEKRKSAENSARIAGLEAELAGISAQSTLSADQLADLLKLRSEVGLLRAANRAYENRLGVEINKNTDEIPVSEQPEI